MRTTAIFLFLACGSAFAQMGMFEDHGDVGAVLHPGSAVFDAAKSTYTITGSGENMWATADAFQFVWKKYSGDIAITADIAFPTKTGNPHKKAVLMIRQTLDADSPYVDGALHVEGLTSLQSRQEKGGETHEVGVASASPTRLRLEKRGSYFYLYMARAGEDFHLAGGSLRLQLKEPFYIGLGVCAHDKDVSETAVFSKVSVGRPSTGDAKLYSTLETVAISSTDRRVVAVFSEPVESPSWTPDSASLLFKEAGRTHRIPVAGGPVEMVDTMGQHAPTTETSPDGKFIYYQTDRAGKSQIWRMAPDGSNPEALVADEFNNWFPHVSPDGQKVAFLSYAPDVSGHPPNKDVVLRVLNLNDSKIKVVATLVGGQGTMNDPPWSPDSKRIAFVSYQTVP